MADDRTARPPWEPRVEDQPASPDTTASPRVFISYAGPDLEVVEWIATQLRGAGYEVEYQHGSFSPGERTGPRIDEALQRADRVLAVISPASLVSRWCRDEWDAAGDKLVPVRIRPVDVPGLRGVRTYVDLFGPDMDDEVRSIRLLEAVAGVQHARRTPGTRSVALPARLARFSGRRQLLRQMYAHFFDSDDRPRQGQRLTLAGISGVGKTAVAVEYAHRMRAYEHYPDCWFVDASRPDTLEVDARSIVSEARPPLRSRSLGVQLREVLEAATDWLLIFDQAVDFESLADYLPAVGRGHVLITSVNPATWGRANVIEVRGWEVTEAVEFLTAETGSDDLAATEELAIEFDGHPDLLSQAASYIDRTGISVRRYLENHRSRELTQENRFAAHLALTVDELERNPLALETLRLGSFLGHHPIPVELLIEGLRAAEEGFDSSEFDAEAIEPLRRLGLAQRDDVELSLSRVVQSEVRRSAIARGEGPFWHRSVLTALDRLLPGARALEDPSVQADAAALLPHVLHVIDQGDDLARDDAITGRLMLRAGALLETTGDLQAHEAGSATGAAAGMPPDEGTSDAVEEMLTTACRLLRRAHGDDHIDVSDALAQLGEHRRRDGRPEEAVGPLTEAVDIAVRVAGASSPDVARRLIQLGRVRRDLGSLAEGVETLDRAIEIASGAGQEDRRLLGDALASRAIAFSLQGRHRSAVEDVDRALELGRDPADTDEHRVATRLATASGVYAASGDDRRAREAADGALRIERRLYGPDSPLLASSLWLAARRALEAGDPLRTHALATEMLTMGDVALPGDATASQANILLAEADRAMGGDGWSELIRRATSEAHRAGLPDAPPKLALARFRIEDGLTDEAVELASEVVADRVEATDWMGAAEALLVQAQALDEGGALDETEQLLRRLLELGERHALPPSLVRHVRVALAGALSRLGRPSLAGEELRQAEAIADEQGEVIELARIGLMRSALRVDQGRFAEAATAARTSLGLLEEHLEVGHPMLIDARFGLAAAEAAAGNQAAARLQCDAAVADTAERAGAESAEVGRVYARVAWALQRMGRHRQAITRAEEAIRIARRTADTSTELLGALLDNGQIILAAGDVDNAASIARWASELLEDEDSIKQIERVQVALLSLQVARARFDYGEVSRIVDELLTPAARDPEVPRSERVTIWLACADAVGDDHETAVRYLDEAVALESDSRTELRREIALRAATLHWMLDENEIAIDRASALLDRYDDREFRLRVFSVLVPALIDQGDEQDLRRWVDETERLHQRSDDPIERANHVLRVGGAYARASRVEEASAALTAARSELGDMAQVASEGDRRTVAALYRDLANHLALLDETTGSIDALEQAAEIYRTLGEREALLSTLHDLAAAAVSAGKTEEAIEWLAQVEEQLPDIRDQAPTVAVLGNQGLRLLDVGDYDRARIHLEEALAQFEQLELSVDADATSLLVPLCEAYDGAGRPDAAEDCFRRILSSGGPTDADSVGLAVERLMSMAVTRADDDARFATVAEFADGLASATPETAVQAAVFVELAQIRADEIGAWDDQAARLAETAHQRLATGDPVPAALVASVAQAWAAALAERGEGERSCRVLNSACTTIRELDDAEVLFETILALAREQAALDRTGAAAETLSEAGNLIDQLPSAPPSVRLWRATSLASAETGLVAEPERRQHGVMWFRKATGIAVDEELVADESTVVEMCRLAMALDEVANDQLRAKMVLAAAVGANARLMETEPDSAGALPILVEALERVRGRDAAAEALRTAVEHEADPLDLATAMSVLVVNAELDESEVLDLLGAWNGPAEVAATASMLGQVLEFAGRPDEASSIIHRVLLELGTELPEPQRVELLVRRAELERDRDGGEARRCLEEALAIARADPQLEDAVPFLRTSLGEVLLEADDEEALAVLSGGPIEPWGEESLALALLRAERYRDALDVLSPMVAVATSYYPSYLLASAEWGLVEHQGALDTAAAALAEFGPVAQLLELCADICSDLGEYEAAIRYATAATEADPEQAGPYEALGWALSNLGPERREDSEAAFDAALVRDPDGLYALKGRADARKRLDRHEEARIDYEAVLERVSLAEDPSLRGWVLLKLDRWDEAEVAFERAIEEHDRPSDRFDLGLCRLMRRPADGVATYRRALAALSERPRLRLAPLRVAHADLQDARVEHPTRADDDAFRLVVAEVEAALSATEELVVPLFLPTIPDPPPATT